MNLWHDLALGDKAPEEFNVVIEIPRGSSNKYEVDKDSGLIKLDRVFYSPFYYPTDYGFAPQTFWHDGDPLDVMVLTTHPLLPGVVVKVRPIGVVHMVDSGDKDEKVIAVAVGDPRYSDTKDVTDLPEHMLKELQHFFEHYKDLEGKKVVINGIEGRAAAVETVKEGMELYATKIKKEV